jgi:hypothetical protein
MAAYIDSTYVGARLGSDLLAAIEALDGVDLDSLISEGTDLVRALLRTNGYEPPDTDDPADITDGTVKLAVFAVVRSSLSSIPEVALPLPADWQHTAEAVALRAIRDGEVNLNMTASTVSGHGGFKFTGTSTTVTGDAPPRATRDELKGF